MRALCIFSSCLVLSLSATAHAETPTLAALSPQELDNLRGGFLLAGGMFIDFAIMQESLVNGQMQRRLDFNSRDLELNVLESAKFHTVIQLGGNTLPEALKDIPGVVSIIRNSEDNALIKNTNILDIDVKNTQAMRTTQTLAPVHETHLLNDLR